MVPVTRKIPQKKSSPWLFFAQYYGRSLLFSCRFLWHPKKRRNSHPDGQHQPMPAHPGLLLAQRPMLPAPKVHDPFFGIAPGKEKKTQRSGSKTLLGLSFVLTVLLLFLAQQVVLLNGGSLLGLRFPNASQPGSLDLNLASQHSPSINASKSLVRISQLDPAQYSTQAEYNTWAYSACSSAALTEIFNAYGNQYRITDVLKVEAAIGEITSQLGLMEDVGVAKTAAKFGFQTNWGDHWSLSQVLSNANAGRPVLVGWPPDRYEGGHIVVVTGGDATSIYLADTSRWNRHVVSVEQFLQWWAGFAAVVTPA